MQGGKRALSSWNIFVKKIYREGKSKNSSYSFQNALKDASKRKSEMGTSSNKVAQGTKKHRKSKRKSSGKKHTRRHRKH